MTKWSQVNSFTAAPGLPFIQLFSINEKINQSTTVQLMHAQAQVVHLHFI
jgi:hypothetical protein